ncbi:hypothetical protein OV079_41265 [Nannocystis pusilla]|uniref:Lipoprotein n=1 Tax=Nannocystis pusilla TaxID=889268 RepID=A0A9X3EXJ9_9BACT|nr:hypothetical protein [Nannocystis pusilla]MCY1011881.1 hypothetical protein [Nannocystis pusilla]
MPRSTLEWPFALALATAACSAEWGEPERAGAEAFARAGDRSNILSARGLDSCATPQFADSAGPGTLVRCEGQLAKSFFYYDQCKLACGNPIKKPVEPVAFPADDEVAACCEAGASAEALAATCKSDCAHGACLGALLRFDELIADPATTAPCGALAGCKARVLESLTHYEISSPPTSPPACRPSSPISCFRSANLRAARSPAASRPAASSCIARSRVSKATSSSSPCASRR